MNHLTVPQKRRADMTSPSEIGGEASNAAAFMETAIREIGGFNYPSRTKVLDFGCGSGQMVDALLQRGFDAYGCDIKSFWSGNQPAPAERLRTILPAPYRLPFDEGSFDVVVSTSVLEHAQNTEELFRAIHKVLKPGGYSMHFYPGKWYLPYEPHIYVPLVNYFWPRCPKSWLTLWAFLGVRNEFQNHLSWKAVAEANQQYCRRGLCYLSNEEYRRLSLEIFGNYSWPMQFYIHNGYGGFTRLLRRFPFTKLWGLVSREVRMAFLVQQKTV
jgi:SAM-dependent methyltransferase